MIEFPLDGFVTEYVNIQLDINKLYCYLSKMEKNDKRKLKML